MAATITSGSMCFSRLICSMVWYSRLAIVPRSKLYDQVRFADVFHRHRNHPALHFNPHLAVGNARQTALEKFLVLDRRVGGNPRQAAREPLELGGPGQLAIKPGRANLENVAWPGNQVFHVEDHTQLMADRFAILVADALGLVNVNAQEALLAHLPLDVQHFQPSERATRSAASR